ncbi:MAG: DNA repair protein RadA [Spirochaetes bacterium GWF1_51_8]|nr:MAG: DNA repair protein RadA [Spirochaetes bacterium GWF1_51_8]
MAKTRSVFLCQECGYKTTKWLGKCPQCGEWNSFVEEVESPADTAVSVHDTPGTGPIAIDKVEYSESSRFSTGIGEFDRAMGGIVPGQAVLLSGEPGIGKSTLLLQTAASLSVGRKVFYINGEESNAQVKSRAARLGIKTAGLYLLNDNNLEHVVSQIDTHKPDILFADSLQTLYSPRYASLPGSVLQVRESAHELISLSKGLGIPLFLVSHITKGGDIAGPKIVEHLVDTVLYIETDSRGYYRILRSLKNRFFSTDEVGFFTMGESGLTGIEDISTAFTSIHSGEVSGVAIFPMIEGNRVFPVEIQGLCTASQFNYPRRAADGIDLNRLSMLAAIMEKKLGANLSASDVYVNITGGLKIEDPALDLAVIFAVYSSLKNKPSALDTIVFGEAGLTGEVRPVFRMEKRLQESKRLGFKRAVIPFQQKGIKPPDGLSVLPVKSIEEGIALL